MCRITRSFVGPICFSGTNIAARDGARRDSSQYSRSTFLELLEPFISKSGCWPPGSLDDLGNTPEFLLDAYWLEKHSQRGFRIARDLSFSYAYYAFRRIPYFTTSANVSR